MFPLKLLPSLRKFNQNLSIESELFVLIKLNTTVDNGLSTLTFGVELGCSSTPLRHSEKGFGITIIKLVLAAESTLTAPAILVTSKTTNMKEKAL